MSTLKRNIIITIMIMIITVLIATAITLIIVNVSAISDPYKNELGFDQSTFVGQWPFTAESVVIRCDDIDDKSIVSITTLSGERYMLNADSNTDIDKPPMKTLSTKDTIWRDTETDTETDKNYLSPADAKVSTDDIIDAGLKLCTKT
ncbi:hypothetical protein [Psychrobacter sp. ASPA161_6]|uniref:hypothetical protein n=1 Tax=Psychrobacter sp. ASPA161_6 TaxID=3160962 RepID=UPI003F8071C8